MENNNSQSQAEESEAIRYARYQKQRKQLEKKKKPIAGQPKPQVPTKAKEAGPSNPPQPTPSNPENKQDKSSSKGQGETPTKPTQSNKTANKKRPRVVDRTTLEKQHMSGHRVGTDIPIRLDREVLYRKEQGEKKTTLAQVTDEVLHVGLEYFEKRRTESAGKGGTVSS